MNDKQLIAIMAAILHAQQVAEHGCLADRSDSVEDAHKLFMEVQSLQIQEIKEGL